MSDFEKLLDKIEEEIEVNQEEQINVDELFQVATEDTHQNATDKYIEQHNENIKKQDELVQNITKNQQFQNSTDEMFKAKEIEEKITEITNSHNHQNNVDEILNRDDYNEEELNYINGPYYANYTYMLENMYNILAPYVLYMEQNYLYNLNYFQDAFSNKNEVFFSLQQLGYPIPERFLNSLNTIMTECINELKNYEDEYFVVNIHPLDYVNKSMNNNVYGKFNGYQVKIENKKITKNIKK